MLCPAHNTLCIHTQPPQTPTPPGTLIIGHFSRCAYCAAGSMMISHTAPTQSALAKQNASKGKAFHRRCNNVEEC